MNSVLVYVDFSPSTLQTVRYAARIADAANLNLLIAHALPNDGVPVMIQINDLVKDLADKKSKNLRLVLLNEFPNVSTEFFQVQGNISTALQHTHARSKIELMVLDEHQRSQLDHQLGSSPLEGLIHRLKCPLLLVPGDTEIQAPVNPAFLDLDGTENLPQLLQLQQRIWGTKFKLSESPYGNGVFSIRSNDAEKDNQENPKQLMSERLSASLEKLLAHKTDLLIIRIPQVKRSDFWTKFLDKALHENHIPCMALPANFLSH